MSAKKLDRFSPDAKTALLRRVLELDETESSLTLAWLDNEGPKRLNGLLNGCLSHLQGRPVPLATECAEDLSDRDDAIEAIAAAVDLLIRQRR